MDEVCTRAGAAGKFVGTYADDPGMARRWIDVGVQCVAVYEGAPTVLDGLVATIEATERGE